MNTNANSLTEQWGLETNTHLLQDDTALTATAIETLWSLRFFLDPPVGRVDRSDRSKVPGLLNLVKRLVSWRRLAVMLWGWVYLLVKLWLVMVGLVRDAVVSTCIVL